MRGYAVVDVETTGLYAGGHHRIIEVAVVHVDPSGEVTGEWATLVNPRRDLGPAAIHGIRAADVRKAPPFATIAPTLASLLAERTMVAHNLPFDAGFLAAEYGRMGFHPPLAGHQGLCTMRMAVDFLPGSQRSLAACCHAASVPLNDQHEALSDARAAAGLLACYLAKGGTPPPWDERARQLSALAWPQLPPSSVVPVRRGHATAVPGGFLARLADRLPRAVDPVVDSYLAVLDEALLDRYISVEEADSLVAVAGQLGMDRWSSRARCRSRVRCSNDARRRRVSSWPPTSPRRRRWWSPPTRTPCRARRARPAPTGYPSWPRVPSGRSSRR
jgi:DNA polymerase-3 subunit epsilon